MRDTIELAREAGAKPSHNPELWDIWEISNEALKRLVALARADEREACAKVAGWLHQQYIDTKDAHERLSSEPFRSSQFGFDQSTVQQSQRIADAIRARGETK